MGVLNVTPDSFSDGGRHDTVDAAVAHGLGMVAAGADYVDVGGESTRPGADRVAAEEELHRVLPVVTELARTGVAVSVDTTRSQVAAAALAAGAVLVNDVSGGLADPAMAAVVADAGVPWVLMHRRGDSRDMDARAGYRDVVADVRHALCRRVDAALAAGVDAGRVVVDPGLGFAKRPEHDLALLAGLEAVTGLGLPVLVGASRKRFLGAVLTAADGRTRTPLERDSATLATTVLAASAGAWGVRVHDVAGSADAVRVLAAVAAAAPQSELTPYRDLAHERRPGEPRVPRTSTDDTERWRSA
ncbi:dihydropteroate synthase [Modestobacter muralis]|uniref:Dihydropteroate synthase n=2 Tax=Modestobacter muralis TaxID=1608614 RepID=A0A6P0H288_9ACTN|nr:dihydropteroate synthase [Modestobacter muralis]NEK93020.1 dihydropteroate synthase [Modestobacter muralis]NEN49787.1 dihydropteroate synthase [Modestobacter muralis]